MCLQARQADFLQQEDLDFSQREIGKGLGIKGENGADTETSL